MVARASCGAANPATTGWWWCGIDIGRLLLPPPLWGRVGVGGRGLMHGGASLHDPHPRPLPTRGRGEASADRYAIAPACGGGSGKRYSTNNVAGGVHV